MPHRPSSPSTGSVKEAGPMHMQNALDQPTHWTVGELASLAHVSVRTIHHYDEIGLLVPSERSAAGYRLYGKREIERLHQILLYRELGFALEAIRRMLDEPAID